VDLCSHSKCHRYEQRGRRPTAAASRTGQNVSDEVIPIVANLQKDLLFGLRKTLVQGSSIHGHDAY
jgi:hypothetical protein